MPDNLIHPTAVSAEAQIGRPTASTNGSVRVAAIQMTAGPDIPANLDEAARLLDMAASQGAKLAALPEYFCLMGMKDADRVAAREQNNDGPIQEFLSDTARRLGRGLIGGSVPLASTACAGRASPTST